MKVVYIAGPFRGPTAWDVEQNVRRAEALALRVARAGAMPLCPHTNTRFFHGQGDDAFWLEGALELLRRCDAIMLTYDWPDSVGAQMERQEAFLRGMPVFDERGGWGPFLDWLKTGRRDDGLPPAPRPISKCPSCGAGG